GRGGGLFRFPRRRLALAGLQRRRRGDRGRRRIDPARRPGDPGRGSRIRHESFRERTMSARAMVLAMALPLALAACEGVKQELGMTKQPPDEFAVVASKAPLVVPPDFTLRPPRPGAPRPQEPQPTEAARNALVAAEQPDARGRTLTAQPGASPFGQ